MSKPASTTPWLCARYKDDETWEWGGDTLEDAINAGLDLWGGDLPDDEDGAYNLDGNRIDGFWVAPAHKSDGANIDDCDPEDHEYTVEAEHAQWIPME